MNTSMKKLLTGGLLTLGLGWLVQQRAEAVVPTTDSIVVSVTPTGFIYSVYISSPYASGYSFGSVPLASTTGSTLAIQVTSTGTIAEYFSMSVVDPGANPWTPVTTDQTPSVADEFELQGHFTAGNTMPQDSVFTTAAGSDLIDTVLPIPAGSLYNQTGGGSIGRTAPGTTVFLWLKMKTPASVSSPATRSMVLSIAGQPN